MATVELLALAIGVVFTTGVITGIALLVSLASRKEGRGARLSREAPDRVTLAGRFLTGLYVRRPGDDPHDHDDYQAGHSRPHRGPRASSEPRARLAGENRRAGTPTPRPAR